MSTIIMSSSTFLPMLARGKMPFYKMYIDQEALLEPMRHADGAEYRIELHRADGIAEIYGRDLALFTAAFPTLKSAGDLPVFTIMEADAPCRQSLTAMLLWLHGVPFKSHDALWTEYARTLANYLGNEKFKAAVEAAELARL